MLLSQIYIKTLFGEVTEYIEMVPSFIIYRIFRRYYTIYSLACGNGVIIVHSHPFKGEHSHTEAQVETIFFLSFFVASSLPAILFVASAFLILLRVLSVPAVEHTKCVRVRCGISLRAPPVVH